MRVGLGGGDKFFQHPPPSYRRTPVSRALGGGRAWSIGPVCDGPDGAARVGRFERWVPAFAGMTAVGRRDSSARSSWFDGAGAAGTIPRPSWPGVTRPSTRCSGAPRDRVGPPGRARGDAVQGRVRGDWGSVVGWWTGWGREGGSTPSSGYRRSPVWRRRVGPLWPVFSVAFVVSLSKHEGVARWCASHYRAGLAPHPPDQVRGQAPLCYGPAVLKGLERDGMLKRTAFATVPPRVDYELTERGRCSHHGCDPSKAVSRFPSGSMTRPLSAR